jgi:phosphoribosylformimino-5-aminoimidazole carboxamide ribotide isomerase
MAPETICIDYFRPMTRFRPCIDLHEGRVKQIVGGTLRESGTPQTHFVSEKDAAYYAGLYREKGLSGGHVIQLGPGNASQAKSALAAFPGGLQVGGGIHPGNVREYLDAGASHVIVTSWLFPEDRLDIQRLEDLSRLTGKDRLVVDLSCRREDRNWFVATRRWQQLTKSRLDAALFAALDPHCAEYLVHAADVEGLRKGPDWDLIRHLSALTEKPVTYAGGASSLGDLDGVETESRGRLDLTIGSALDIFGGTEVRFEDCVAWNRARSRQSHPPATAPEKKG